MSVEQTLTQRRATHGDYADHAHITQALKATARRGVQWGHLDDQETEALEMILHKIGRILSGDPHFPDHWHDIAGYATLVESKLTDA